MRAELLLLVIVTFFGVVFSNEGIICSLCKGGLTGMTNSIQSNYTLMRQMGDSISQACGQVPNQQQRKACQLTLDNHFPLFMKTFVQQPTTSADEICKGMGYC
ncbi:surfactant protein B [Dictyocaulus viviparus]|uniref:Surfactant protein B n=1 Tax=Dictyocaulus viviparus TaxID=29172 RepID=A0A0D8Y1R8_DICVI|nr:surfactant protein B [Dictyocaulus viviparus]